MTEPYYQDDSVTIYHGDSREINDWLAADILVTDPPYGIDYSSGYTDTVWIGGAYSGAADGSIEGDIDLSARDAILTLWGQERPALVFGSLRVAAPIEWRQALIWDKGEAAGMGDLSIPWKPNWELIFILGRQWAGTTRTTGVIRENNISRVSMGRRHPHEKPPGLIRRLLAPCPPGVVADPFMGSGTTLRAAKDLGRKAIGVELDERYCEVAARRLGQEVLTFG